MLARTVWVPKTKLKFDLIRVLSFSFPREDDDKTTKTREYEYHKTIDFSAVR